MRVAAHARPQVRVLEAGHAHHVERVVLRDGGARALSGALPAVMSTQQPRHRRWFARAELLDDVLRDPRNLSVMDALGYDPDPRSWL